MTQGLISTPGIGAFMARLRGGRRERRRLRAWAVRGAAVGFWLVIALLVLQLTLRDNVRVVQPGQVYRAGQMQPDRLRAFVQRHDIRTIVNLRGYCGEFAWYRAECAVTHELDISQEDVTLSAIRLPAPGEIRRLIEVLDQAERPLLLHCRQGVDRTGLAAVAARLLEPGVAFDDAARHLGLGYGYVALNGTQEMRRFVNLYRTWLADLGRPHHPDLFRHWAQREYCPGRCRAEMRWLDWPEGGWPAEQGRVLAVRAVNTSIEPWPLRPGANQGVHLRFRLDGPLEMDGRAGQFDAVVAPGAAIDLALGLPPLPPGTYTLTAGMVDVDENAFCQFGVAPLRRSFRVVQ